MPSEAKIVLTAEDRAARVIAGVKASLGQLEGSATSLGAAFSGLGLSVVSGLSIGAIATFFKTVVDGLDHLNDLKDATGASIENLSALEDIALRTGTSMDTAGDAVLKLNKALNTASDPDSDAAAAFKALGLSVDELKRQDPVEALRQVGVALSGFADDANKGRIEQVLLGKATGEIAPLLKDLAEAGKLNATVTTEQAEEAERFNKELFALQKNILDASRALAGPMITALNDVSTGFRQAEEDGKSFYRKIFEGQLRLLGIKDFKLFGQQFGSEGRFTGGATGDWGDEPKKPSLPPSLNKPKVSKPPAERQSDLERYIEGLQRQLEATQNLSAAEKVWADIQAGRTEVENTDQIALLLGIAGEIDMRKRRAEEVKAEAEQLRDFYAAQKLIADEGARIFAETRTPAEELGATLAHLNELLAAGVISWDTYARATFKAQDAFDATIEKAQKAASEADQFTQRAAKNIQDALGNTLVDVMEGNFRSITAGFTHMLTQMVAQAAAAKIARSLFGDLLDTQGSGGSGGTGLVGGALQWLGKALFEPRAAGGPVAAGSPYIVGERGPEFFVPRSAGTIVPMEKAMAQGPAPVINVIQHFAPGTTAQTTGQAAVQAGRAVARYAARGTN